MLTWAAVTLGSGGLASDRARAQTADRAGATAPQGGRVLHRRLPSPDGEPDSSSVFVYDPTRAGALPSELERDGLVLPQPSPSAPERDGELVYSPDGMRVSDGKAPDDPALTALGAEDAPPDSEGGGPESPSDDPASSGPGASDGGDEGPGYDPRRTNADEARPDRRTGAEERLDYHTVFDPSIVPFKRNHALDRVTRDYALRLGVGRREEVRPTGNKAVPGHEVFWGNVLIDGEAGRDIPLPSVAPTSRILSYEAEPPQPLRFFRDQADNLYVRPEESGRFRLVVVMDAPSRYFGAPLPEGVTLSDVPTAIRPTPPQQVVKAALRVARVLGLEGVTDYATVVDGLVRWFRSFAPGDPPEEREDVYVDLAIGRRGICRHRAFAFVVTAHGLGVPARYVYNEAHVFVEVWMPGASPGWMRIDLGGGADRLVVHGGDDKVRHQPRGRDPFSRPEPYQEAADRGQVAGAMAVEGLPPLQRGRRATARSEGTEPAPDAGGVGGADGEPLGPGDVAIPRPVAVAGAAPTTTTLEADDAVVFRGERLTLRGTVRRAGAGAVRGGSVQVLLREAGTEVPIRLLGVVHVGPDGRFSADVAVPEGHPPGDYEIVAQFLGDEEHAPSTSL